MSLPLIESNEEDFYTDDDQQEAIETSRTYRMLGDSINGKIDDLESVRQAVRKILSTERYEYPIYSLDYGLDLSFVIGKDLGYVEVVLKRLISEALLKDNRIVSVTDFEIDINGDECKCSFSVETIFGMLDEGLEVTV